jgi:hypothetical protein
MTDGPAPPSAPPRWARYFVATLLVALVVCALGGIEAWPLTGWHLFSRSRPERAVGFAAFAVGQDGTERPVPFDRMSYAYRGYTQILGGFGALPDRERSAICAAWARGAEPFLGRVSELHIYRHEVHLSERRGRRGVPPRRSLVAACTL